MISAIPLSLICEVPVIVWNWVLTNISYNVERVFFCELLPRVVEEQLVTSRIQKRQKLYGLDIAKTSNGRWAGEPDLARNLRKYC